MTTILLIILMISMWTLGARIVHSVHESVPFMTIFLSVPVLPFVFMEPRNRKRWTNKVLLIALIPYGIAIATMFCL